MMRDYDEFIEEVQRDLEVPQEVWEKFEQTLQNLPEKRSKSLRMRAAAAAVVILVTGTGLCLVNPTLASRLPVIGKIFQEVESQVTFSGEYSGRSMPLTEENGEAEDYTVKDQGVEITPSEIYCDGYSIFLTVQIKAEGQSMTHMPKEKTVGQGADTETGTVQIVGVNGTWNLEGRDREYNLLNNTYFEGKALDDQTFIGMIKLDLEEEPGIAGVLQMSVSQVRFGGEVAGSDTHLVTGDWDIAVPFQVDTEGVKIFRVEKRSENGYGIEKVMVSLSQVVIYVDVPYRTLTEEELPKENFERIQKEEEGSTDKRKVTYEEYLKWWKVYEYCEVKVYDQDGEEIWFDHNLRKDSSLVLAIGDRKITELHIYLFDNPENVISDHMSEDTAKKQAVLSAEISVN